MLLLMRTGKVVKSLERDKPKKSSYVFKYFDNSRELVKLNRKNNFLLFFVTLKNLLICSY